MRPFINTLTLGILFFVLIFCWLTFVLGNVALCALAALSASALLCIVAYTLTKNNRGIRNAKRKKEAQKLGTHLCLNDERKTIERMFSDMGYALTETPHGYVMEKTAELQETYSDPLPEQNIPVEIEGTQSRPLKIAVITYFFTDALGERETAKYLRLYRDADKILFLCRTYNASAQRIAAISKVKCIFWDCNRLYGELAKRDLLPCLADKKRFDSPNVFLSVALSSGRSGYYIFCSVFLALFSFVSFMPIYNLIFATLLSATGLYARYNKRFNAVNDSSSL